MEFIHRNPGHPAAAAYRSAVSDARQFGEFGLDGTWRFPAPAPNARAEQVSRTRQIDSAPDSAQRLREAMAATNARLDAEAAQRTMAEQVAADTKRRTAALAAEGSMGTPKPWKDILAEMKIGRSR
jgi:hypothetical protein